MIKVHKIIVYLSLNILSVKKKKEKKVNVNIYVTIEDQSGVAARFALDQSDALQHNCIGSERIVCAF